MIQHFNRAERIVPVKFVKLDVMLILFYSIFILFYRKPYTHSMTVHNQKNSTNFSALLI